MFNYILTLTGQNHLFQNLPCQDHAARYRCGSVAAIALCDGVSSCKYGSEAADYLADALVKEFASSFDKWFNMSEEAFKVELVDIIRDTQTRLSLSVWDKDNGVWLCDEGCTLLAAALDARTGRHIAVNLGDGAILARRKADDKMEPLLLPIRVRFGKKILPVVTVYDAQTIMRFSMIDRGCNQYDAFFLSSDGLEEVMYTAGGKISPSVSAILEDMVQHPAYLKSTLAQSIADLHCDDDVSMNILVNRPPEVSTFCSTSPLANIFPGRRRLRRLCDFARALDKGFNVRTAAAKAGLTYRKRDLTKAFMRLREAGII